MKVSTGSNKPVHFSCFFLTLLSSQDSCHFLSRKLEQKEWAEGRHTGGQVWWRTDTPLKAAENTVQSEEIRRQRRPLRAGEGQRAELFNLEPSRASPR